MPNPRRKKKKVKQTQKMVIALSAAFLLITVCTGTAAFLLKDKEKENSVDEPVLEQPVIDENQDAEGPLPHIPDWPFFVQSQKGLPHKAFARWKGSRPSAFYIFFPKHSEAL